MLFPNERYKDVYSKIIINNVKRDWQTLSEHAELNSEAIRRHPEEIPDRNNIRPAFSHDTDRVIHCLAYSRYIDKTQVFFQAKSDHVTRRVLHVQLVSKIARAIARFIKVNEDLVEAIALAHDIGHAPFGHAGEEYIAEFLEEHNEGSFIHNAQSVRVLDVLENQGKGMNLTLQVLDGVLGHNGELLQQEIKPNSVTLNWEALDNNVRQCFTSPRIDKPEKKIHPSTLEGCIVRVSDVIAYLGRDIEDAILLKMINREDLPAEATRVVGSTNREIINNLIMDIVHNSGDGDAVRFSPDVFNSLDLLLKFNYQQIYQAEVIEEQQVKLRRIVRDLFDVFIDDIDRNDRSSSVYTFFLSDMPNNYQDKTSKYRIAADFISGMTDRFLLDQYKNRFLPDRIDYTVLN